MPDIPLLTPRKHEFLGRPYTGSVETLVAIDKEMRAAVRTVASHLPIRIPQDARFNRARIRVRRHVNANWRQGPMDGFDLLAWLRDCDWNELGRGMRR
ncbi:MAG: hypothetical protein WC326_02035 [Candidatus Delongbacteria bacterium]